jgi:ribosomal protein S18 acetylase RimI-like enzyme
MIEIRRAVAADIESIATVHIACWRATYRGILPDAHLDALNLDERIARWRTWIDADVFVAIDDDRIIGFSRVKDGEISHVYVDPQRQRSGAGRLLLRAVVDAAGGNAVLWVLEENHRARAFYEANGFSFDGTRKTDPQFLGCDAAELRYTIGSQ